MSLGKIQNQKIQDSIMSISGLKIFITYANERLVFISDTHGLDEFSLNAPMSLPKSTAGVRLSKMIKHGT